MLFIDLKHKFFSEVNLQFDSILDWLSAVGEVSDRTILEQIIQRKNFLIVGIYSANEYLLETAVSYYFNELYDAIENETGKALWVRSEKLKIESCIRNNHNGTKDGLEEMLSKIIGNSHTKKILENIRNSMGDTEYGNFCKEMKELKFFRDKQAHSSVNFFSTDIAGIAIDIENTLISTRINNLRSYFHIFGDHLYDELNKLYLLP